MLIQSFAWDFNKIRKAASNSDQNVDDDVKVVTLQPHKFSTRTHVRRSGTLLLAFWLKYVLSRCLLQWKFHRLVKVINFSLNHLNKGWCSVLEILAFVTIADFSLKILHALPLLLFIVSWLAKMFSKREANCSSCFYLDIIERNRWDAKVAGLAIVRRFYRHRYGFLNTWVCTSDDWGMSLGNDLSIMIVHALGSVERSVVALFL